MITDYTPLHSFAIVKQEVHRPIELNLYLVEPVYVTIEVNLEHACMHLRHISFFFSIDKVTILYLVFCRPDFRMYMYIHMYCRLEASVARVSYT